MTIENEVVAELLRTKPDGRLFHRENQELEFKEQFNLAGLAEYFRDFAALANNRGGYLVFGVTDSPREATGLSATSLEQFEKIDPERISGFLIEIFSPAIDWEQATFEIGGLPFGVFRIHSALEKPIVAKKDEGKGQTIRNGDIFYRYAGRSQRVQFAELESIIRRRVDDNNSAWISLVKRIGAAGPSRAAVMDTEKGLLSRHDSQVLVVDEALVRKLSFIKEGEFSEREGTTTLKLVGDVVPVDHVEVVKRVRENLTKRYPLSAMELVKAVQVELPEATQHKVWKSIAENDMKSNPDYSAYNFRNRKQEEEYAASGKIPSVTPSIYNRNAVDFIVNVLKG